MWSYRRKQRGVALITAILITAMVSIAAVSMTARQALDIRRTANILHSDQAYLYALSVEVFAKTGLANDQSPSTDDREEEWAQQAFSLPVEGGNIAGSLIDLNAAFPINNIRKNDGTVNRDYQAAFLRLLRILDVRTPDTAAAGVADWLDADDTTSPNGREDSDYLSLDKPYRTGNTEMASLSELRLVLGFLKDEDGKDLDLLLPKGKEAFVNALPNSRGSEVTMINVNTAPVEVLMSLHKDISRQAAEDIVAARTGQTPKLFTNKNAIANKIATDYAKISTNFINGKNGQTFKDKFVRDVSKLSLDVKSEYFEVTSVAQIGTAELTLKSLLYRPEKAITSHKPQLIKTIRRGIGEY